MIVLIAIVCREKAGAWPPADRASSTPMPRPAVAKGEFPSQLVSFSSKAWLGSAATDQALRPASAMTGGALRNGKMFPPNRRVPAMD
jgi:hypothetical protein